MAQELLGHTRLAARRKLLLLGRSINKRHKQESTSHMQMQSRARNFQSQ
jgi:hypothetical protein